MLSFQYVSLVLAAAVLTACGRGDRTPEPLAYVPADTPYVVANLEREPFGVWGALQAVLGTMSEEFPLIIDEARADLSNPAIDADVRRVRLRLLELVEDKLTMNGWERVGFRRDALFALYGIGLTRWSSQVMGTRGGPVN